MLVITLIYSKRYIRTYRKRVYRCDGLVWLIMIHLTVPKTEIDIPKRDMQSKSPSDCSIDLFSILWFYCRLWFIVSDDGRFWFKKNQYFPLRNSHFHGGKVSSVLFYHIASQQTGYTVAVYFSNIIGKYGRWWFSMTVEITSLPRSGRNLVVSLNSIIGQSKLITHDC